MQGNRAGRRLVGVKGKWSMNPNLKNIKSGILLSPGPISNYQSVQNLSRVFHSAVTKQKFLDGAAKLHQEGFGTLVYLDEIQKTCAFVKRPLHEMQIILENTGSDLCTYEEYERWFRLNLPASIGVRTVDILRRKGYLLDYILPKQES